MKRPRAAILPILLGALAGSPLACADDEPVAPGATPPPPAATGSATGTAPGSDGTTAAELPSSCACLLEGGADCPCQACAADHALGDPPPPAEAFTCRADCIPAGEARLWCFYDPDAADPALGCCSGVCRPDGLCGDPIEETSGPSPDTGSSTDDPTTGSTTTTDTDPTTDTDSSTSSATTTDATTTTGASSSTG